MRVFAFLITYVIVRSYFRENPRITKSLPTGNIWDSHLAKLESHVASSESRPANVRRVSPSFINQDGDHKANLSHFESIGKNARSIYGQSSSRLCLPRFGIGQASQRSEISLLQLPVLTADPPIFGYI